MRVGMRIVGTAARVEFGRGGEPQWATDWTEFAILLLTESLRYCAKTQELQTRE